MHIRWEFKVHFVNTRLAGNIKFGGLAPKDVFNTIGGLKFGGMVRYRNTTCTIMHEEKILIWQFKCIPPNLIPCQISRYTVVQYYSYFVYQACSYK